MTTNTLAGGQGQMRDGNGRPLQGVDRPSQAPSLADEARQAKAALALMTAERDALLGTKAELTGRVAALEGELDPLRDLYQLAVEKLANLQQTPEEADAIGVSEAASVAAKGNGKGKSKAGDSK